MCSVDESEKKYSLLFRVIQGAPKVLTRFCEAISREPLVLQKWDGCQKMRLILQFCLFFLKKIVYLPFFKIMSDLRKKSFFDSGLLEHPV
jgi:hypothetical protein